MYAKPESTSMKHMHNTAACNNTPHYKLFARVPTHLYIVYIELYHLITNHLHNRAGTFTIIHIIIITSSDNPQPSSYYIITKSQDNSFLKTTFKITKVNYITQTKP